MKDIYNRLIGVIKSLDESINVVDLSPQDHFIYDLGLESFSLITLIFLCEEEFDIKLSDKINDIAQIETVEKLLQVIEDQL